MLESGQYYWFKHARHIPGERWNICYIGEDCDDNQWWHTMDNDPIAISGMDLDAFQFKGCINPSDWVCSVCHKNMCEVDILFDTFVHMHGFEGRLCRECKTELDQQEALEGSD